MAQCSSLKECYTVGTPMQKLSSALFIETFAKKGRADVNEADTGIFQRHNSHAQEGQRMSIEQIKFWGAAFRMMSSWTPQNHSQRSIQGESLYDLK